MYSYKSFKDLVRTHLITISLLAVAILIIPMAASAFFSGGAVPLQGYAWSSTIGWISFEASDRGGVTIATDGRVTGYGWSPNIGWVKFGGLSSFPSGGGVSPQNARLIETPAGSGNYTLQGWARACAGTVSGDCSSMTSRTDGWDGWIGLSGTTHSVRFSATGPVAGSYAWGGAVVGWVDMFSRITYTPTTPVVPTTPTGSINVSGCSVALGNSSCTGTVNWTINNPSTPTSANVQRFLPSPAVVVSTALTGPINQTMNLGSNIYRARDNTAELAVGSATVACQDANAGNVGGVCTCNSGYTNTAGVCVADTTIPPPTGPATGDVTVTGCSVALGNSSCTGNVTWTINNATNPNVQRTSPNVGLIGSALTGNVNQTMNLGSTYTYRARNDLTVLDTGSVTISCADANASNNGSGVCACDSGYAEVGGVCTLDTTGSGVTPTGLLTINPKLARVNQTVSINWDVTGATACEVTSTQDSSVISGGAVGSDSLTVSVNNQIVVTLTCEGTVVDQETITVLPALFES